MIAFFGRLWTFVRPYRVRLFLGLVCGLLFALTSGAMMLLVRLVVDVVVPGADHFSLAEQVQRMPELIRPLVQSLIQRLPEIQSPTSDSGKILLICALPALMLVRGLCSYLNVYLINWASVRAIADLRTKLFDHLQNLSLDFFSSARTGDLIARVVNDTQVLNSVIANSFGSLIKDPLTVLTLAAVLLSQPSTRKLTLISIIVLPVCLVPISIYARKVRKSAKAMQGHLADLSSLMHEIFTGNRIIKAYNLEDTVLGQFLETTRRFVGHMMRVVRAVELPSHLTEFLGVVGVSLVLLAVVLDPDPSAHHPGDFVAFVLSILLMYQPIKTLIRLYNQLHQAAAASQHVFELLAMKSAIADPPLPVPLHAAHADIHFEDIDFDYDQKPVLRGINLSVRAGQLVALVGKSGSGKTTLTNLLLRFYDPQRGSVRIGATDLRQVAIKDLRRQIALVTQDTILFNDTIRRNIALGRPGASDADIEAAAKHANAYDFILEKPDGFETVIGEKGVALSGGQRQRLAIARAILKDAPILILDEATSALDTEAERAVQAAFDDLMQGRTTICIAHRFSTIQKADLIVVLENGRIAEQGTHAQLLRRGGIYCKLYELQFEPALA
jgi:subfamily B ATP-binding cassette protein MsbA